MKQHDPYAVLLRQAIQVTIVTRNPGQFSSFFLEPDFCSPILYEFICMAADLAGGAFFQMFICDTV